MTEKNIMSIIGEVPSKEIMSQANMACPIRAMAGLATGVSCI